MGSRCPTQEVAGEDDDTSWEAQESDGSGYGGQWWSQTFLFLERGGDGRLEQDYVAKQMVLGEKEGLCFVLTFWEKSMGLHSF